jgi:uncharacterized DUF497 family protein
MSFEWDPKKAAANERKHGVQFADAISALEDERAVTVIDDSAREERWSTIGTDSIGRIVVVVYTWRTQRVRIISVRRATPRERRQYEHGL